VHLITTCRQTPTLFGHLRKKSHVEKQYVNSKRRSDTAGHGLTWPTPPKRLGAPEKGLTGDVSSLTVSRTGDRHNCLH
jgi:hypothetical protein